MSDQEHIDRALIVAAGLRKHLQQLIGQGLDPAVCLDACLALMVHAVSDHLAEDQRHEFAAWLREWADNLEGKGDAPLRH